MRSSALAALLAIVVLAGAGSMASAGAGDSAAPALIDEHIEQMERASDYKVRLSAAVWLAKTHEPRAMAALLRVLESEPSKTMRRLAALSLGTMVDADTPSKLRVEVERALAHAAEQDRDRKVRRHAQRSLEKLATVPARPDVVSPQPPRPTPRPQGEQGVFLHVSAPRDVARKSPKGMSPLLHDTVRGALRKHAPEYRLDWPAKTPPTASDLEQARMHAYRVQAAVMEYRIHPRGSQAEVECQVTVQVNPWQGSDTPERWSERQAAAATGRGRVRGDNRSEAIAAAQRDCVTTVAERITSEQVVPFLRRLEAAKQ
jgi:HEAT repeats